MNRIDALVGHDARRLELLTGRALDDDVDDELQQIVAEASATLGMPIALVSLVLQRTQHFRAHCGLPSDLAVASSTDRDVSFCQFVVRDGCEFVVTDAKIDDRVPEDLVHRYGIRAYLGSPIRIGDAVVGSLCTIDVRAREFDAEDRRNLAVLAERASARIAALAAMRRVPTLLERGARPVFAELRNLLVPLTMETATARIALADLAPLARLVGELPGHAPPALGSLVQAARAIDDLRDHLDAIAESAEAIRANLEALAKLVVRSARASAGEVIATADRLAHHHTKLVGGVRWPTTSPECRLRATRALSTCVVTSALSALAGHLAGRGAPIEARIEVVDASLHVRLSVSANDAVERSAAELHDILEGEATIRVRADGATLVIELDLVGEP